MRQIDKPIELALQPFLARAYDNGRYARTIDYSQELEPPLKTQDAAWADELLRTAGRRA